jgi:DNA-binding NarL/FixJ family response regulator
MCHPHPLAMSAAIAHQLGDSSNPHILCVGDDVTRLLQIQRRLDADFDVVIVTCAEEGHATLQAEGPFDVIIYDEQLKGARAASFLMRLRTHSPDAERIILARKSDRAARAMAARDSRVMRLLLVPCAAHVLCDALSDALLRHRARMLRASTVPHVTPMGGHPCCVRDPSHTDG